MYVCISRGIAELLPLLFVTFPCRVIEKLKVKMTAWGKREF